MSPTSYQTAPPRVAIRNLPLPVTARVRPRRTAPHEAFVVRAPRSARPCESCGERDATPEVASVVVVEFEDLDFELDELERLLTLGAVELEFEDPETADPEVELDEEELWPVVCCSC